MGLIRSLDEGDVLKIGDSTVQITKVRRKSGKVRVNVVADKGLPITVRKPGEASDGTRGSHGRDAG